jgi:hypothetical protein
MPTVLLFNDWLELYVDELQDVADLDKAYQEYTTSFEEAASDYYLD